jgi:hypothetical protein
VAGFIKYNYDKIGRAHIGENTNVYRVLVEKPKGQNHYGDRDVYRSITLK